MRSKIATIKLTLCTKNLTEKTDNRIASASAALGPKGIKAIDFIRTFDEETKHFEQGTPLIVKISAELDSNGRVSTFKHKIGEPSVSVLVKKKLGVEKLSTKPGKIILQSVDDAFVEEIALLKSKQSPYTQIDSIKKSVIGTLKSMGISVVSKN